MKSKVFRYYFLMLSLSLALGLFFSLSARP